MAALALVNTLLVAVADGPARADDGDGGHPWTLAFSDEFDGNEVDADQVGQRLRVGPPIGQQLRVLRPRQQRGRRRDPHPAHRAATPGRQGLDRGLPQHQGPLRPALRLLGGPHVGGGLRRRPGDVLGEAERRVMASRPRGRRGRRRRADHQPPRRPLAGERRRNPGPARDAQPRTRLLRRLPRLRARTGPPPASSGTSTAWNGPAPRTAPSPWPRAGTSTRSSTPRCSPPTPTAAPTPARPISTSTTCGPGTTAPAPLPNPARRHRRRRARPRPSPSAPPAAGTRSPTPRPCPACPTASPRCRAWPPPAATPAPPG